MKQILSLLLLLVSNSSYGFKLTITNRNYINPALQPTLDTLADNIESQFNSAIASASNQSLFLGEVGNANAASSKSFLSPGVISADHQFFMNVGAGLGLSLGTGASLSGGISLPQNKLPPIGVGGKVGVTVGVSAKNFPNLLPLDPSRLMYTASFYSMDLSRLIGHGVSLKSMQAALGLSYQAYSAQSWTPLIRFNGFKITSGLSYSTLEASYSTPFNLTSSSGGTDMSMNNNVNVGVSSGVFSLANEVTTGVRLLWFLNLYTGIGLDFNVGSSKLTGGSSGPVTATQASTQVFSGTAVVDGDSDGTAPSWIQVRYLLGTQFDLGPVGVYVQGQISTPSAYGLNFGAHFMF